MVKSGDSLLVESLDRLSRDEVLEALGLFSRILKKGVQIITYSDRRIYTRETASDLGTIMYSIMVMARAHEESQVKAERLKKTWANKRSKLSTEKLTRIAPYWLKLVNGKYEVIEERAVIIRRIFAKVISGVGIDSVAKQLNAAGVESWRPSKKTGRTNGWQKSYVLKILRNRAVLGEFQPHIMARLRQPSGVFKKTRVPEGKPVEKYFPRIISPSVFEQAGRSLTVRRFAGAGRKGEGRNLFVHVTRCECCKGPVVYINKGKWRYLACDNARRKVRCDYVSWPYENFETTFLTWVRGLDTSRIAGVDFEGHIKEIEIERGAVLQKVETEKRKLERLLEVITGTKSAPLRIIEEMNATEAKIDALKGTVGELNTKIGELRDRQENGAASLEDLKTLDLSTAGARENARKEIREKIERIEVDFKGTDALCKNRPNFKIYFHKEFAREYVLVPNEHDPADLHMIIEYADGEMTASEKDD